MVKIQNKPLLGYWLDLLMENGIERIMVNTHYLSDAVVDFISESQWAPYVDIAHEDVLLGTAGTVLKNRDFSSQKALMIAHADNLTRFNPSKLILAHSERRPNIDLTMMTFGTDDPSSCGIVELDDFGVVQAFHEKVENPPGNIANAAVYIMEPQVVDFIASLDKSVCDISTEVLPHFIGRIQTFHNSDYHRDIGTIESLARAEKEFLWMSQTI